MVSLVYCPVCSKTISSDAPSCIGCGDPQGKYLKTEMVRSSIRSNCTNCGGRGSVFERETGRAAQTCSYCSGSGKGDVGWMNTRVDSRRRV